MMARVWELIAGVANGMPPQIIFYVDSHLPLRGWGWAPFSLLQTSSPGVESALDFHDISARCAAPRDKTIPFGVPTKAGLKVSFPGMRLKFGSWRKDTFTGEGILWQAGLIRSHPANHLICYHAQERAWYRVVSFYQARVVEFGTITIKSRPGISNIRIHFTMPYGQGR